MKYILFSAIILFTSLTGWSQVDTVKIDSNKVVQFSGIIAEGDSLYGILGAIVQEKTTGRGTTTNRVGYFNLPVSVGDTIKVTALGFKRKTLVIPYDTADSYTILINLEEDTLSLPEVDIYAFPSEKVFKELIVNMELEKRQEYNNLDVNFNTQTLNHLVLTSSLDGAATNRYYLQQQTEVNARKNSFTPNPLLNPFAWSQFVKDIQYYKRKKEKEKKEKENKTSY